MFIEAQTQVHQTLVSRQLLQWEMLEVLRKEITLLKKRMAGSQNGRFPSITLAFTSGVSFVNVRSRKKSSPYFDWKSIEFNTKSVSCKIRNLWTTSLCDRYMPKNKYNTVTNKSLYKSPALTIHFIHHIPSFQVYKSKHIRHKPSHAMAIPWTASALSP